MLKEEDIKTLGQGVEDTSEGQRQVSWIWITRSEPRLGEVASEEEMNESKCL